MVEYFPRVNAVENIHQLRLGFCENRLEQLQQLEDHWILYDKLSPVLANQALLLELLVRVPGKLLPQPVEDKLPHLLLILLRLNDDDKRQQILQLL